MPVQAPAQRKEHLLADSPRVKDELHKLAIRLIAFRSDHDIPRRVVAALVGCSQSNIACIETEESAPSFALSVALKELMEMKAHSVRRLIKEKGIEA